MMPDPSLDSFFFWNSGSEAIEAAMKMARLFTGKQNIIAMQGAYHGRTFGAMAVTKSKTIYSEGFHPLMVMCTLLFSHSLILTIAVARCLQYPLSVLAPAFTSPNDRAI